jgi:hypothetical protein
MECGETKIPLSLGPIQPVEEGGDINQLGARLQIVKVEQLLTVHNFPFARSMAFRPRGYNFYSRTVRQYPSGAQLLRNLAPVLRRLKTFFAGKHFVSLRLSIGGVKNDHASASIEPLHPSILKLGFGHVANGPKFACLGR